MKIILIAVVFTIILLSSPLHAYAIDLVGTKWKVTSQSPSKREIMILSMKYTYPDQDLSSAAILDDVETTTLSITEDALIWEDIYVGGSGHNRTSMSYMKKGMKLVTEIGLANLTEEQVDQLDGFRKIAYNLSPKYYTYSLNGDQLVLVTDPVVGFGNKQITYNLSQIK